MKFTLSSLRPSGTGLAAGIAAGVASVLLAMLTAQHPPLTLLLGFLSPLPIMIAALAFGPLAGLASVVAGTFFVVVFDMKFGHLVIAEDPTGLAALGDGVVFLLSRGIPALVLVLVASLPPRPPRAGAAPPSMRPDELRLSRSVVAGVGCAIVAVAAMYGIGLVATDGWGAMQAKSVAATVTALKAAIAANPSLAKTPMSDADLTAYAALLVALEPWVRAGFAVVFYLLNLYIAARIALASGGIAAKDWPDIPRNLRLPRLAAVVLAVSLGISVTTGGAVGLASNIVSAALLMAFCLQGLAVVHALTRGRSWRLPALVLAYAVAPIPLSLLGLVDAAFSFRDRQAPVIRKQDERKSPWK